MVSGMATIAAGIRRGTYHVNVPVTKIEESQTSSELAVGSLEPMSARGKNEARRYSEFQLPG